MIGVLFDRIIAIVRWNQLEVNKVGLVLLALSQPVTSRLTLFTLFRRLFRGFLVVIQMSLSLCPWLDWRVSTMMFCLSNLHCHPFSQHPTRYLLACRYHPIKSLTPAIDWMNDSYKSCSDHFSASIESIR